MSAEENKPVIRPLREEALIYNQDRPNVLDELAAQDVVKHPAFPDNRHGIEASNTLTWMHDYFLDRHYAIEAKIAEGDMVAVRVAFSGSRVVPRGSRDINDRAL